MTAGGGTFGAHRRNATIVGGEFLVRRRGNKGFLFCRCAAITPVIMGLF